MVVLMSPKHQFCRFFGMGGTPKIGGFTPKMDGENNGKPYENPVKMDDLGGKPTIFGNTQNGFNQSKNTKNGPNPKQPHDLSALFNSSWGKFGFSRPIFRRGWGDR